MLFIAVKLVHPGYTRVAGVGMSVFTHRQAGPGAAAAATRSTRGTARCARRGAGWGRAAAARRPAARPRARRPATAGRQTRVAGRGRSPIGSRVSGDQAGG